MRLKDDTLDWMPEIGNRNHNRFQAEAGNVSHPELIYVCQEQIAAIKVSPVSTGIAAAGAALRSTY
jgi:hypothetical protein